MHTATLLQPLETTLRVSILYDDRGQQVVHSGLSSWVEGRGVHLIGDAASRRGLSRVGYLIPPNGPLNGHPPSYNYTAFISRHVSQQFGNAKAHINKHAHVKSITKKINKSQQDQR